MVTLRLTTSDDVNTILTWNEPSENFLTQWSNFTYPLTKEQFIERINAEDFTVFSIEYDRILAGTVQLFSLDKESKTAKIGCYLLNPNLRGKGIGTSALELLSQYAFKNLDLEKLKLSVFDFNTGAMKCYQKVGFCKTGEYQLSNGWIGYNMELTRG